MQYKFDTAFIIESYASGYFLMADPDTDELRWYKSLKRTIIPLDNRFRYPKSLQRKLNSGRFEYSINRAFPDVLKGCQARESTWISEELQQIYLQLHTDGWAHSFESWQGGELAGGILGIAINGLFIGESMFYSVPDGSKVALVKLVEHLRQKGFTLFDVQLNNPHLNRFGAVEITDVVYEEELGAAVGKTPIISKGV
jgi:leucyl/phenylalanyl-tRNA---protein transferase